MGEFYGIMAAFCFALNGILTQKGLRDSSAATAVITGILINVLFFTLLVVFSNRQEIALLTLPAAAMFAVSGLAASVAGRYLYFLGISKIGVSRSISLRLTENLFASIFGLLFLQEVLRLKTVSGVLLLTGGIWLVLREGRVVQETALRNSEKKAALSRQNITWGVSLSILSAIAFAGADVFRKTGIGAFPFPFIASLTGAAAALLGQSLLITLNKEWNKVFTISRYALSCFILGGLANSLAVLFTFLSLQQTFVYITVAMRNIQPWFVFVLAPFLLGKKEKFSFSLFLALLLLSLGVALIMIGRYFV